MRQNLARFATLVVLWAAFATTTHAQDCYDNCGNGKCCPSGTLCAASGCCPESMPYYCGNNTCDDNPLCTGCDGAEVNCNGRCYAAGTDCCNDGSACSSPDRCAVGGGCTSGAQIGGGNVEQGGNDYGGAASGKAGECWTCSSDPQVDSLCYAACAALTRQEWEASCSIVRGWNATDCCPACNSFTPPDTTRSGYDDDDYDYESDPPELCSVSRVGHSTGGRSYALLGLFALGMLAWRRRS